MDMIRRSLELFVVTLFTFMVSGKSFNAQQTHTLVINNLGNKKGVLHIGWYNNAGDFRKPDKAVLSRSVAVEGKETVSVVFENVREGSYAIAVFLDINGDKKINTNMLGIPRERYGFSNNVYPAFRAANFKEASFEINEKESTQAIRLK